MTLSAVIASVVSLYYRITYFIGPDKFWNAANIQACVSIINLSHFQIKH